MYRLKDIVDSFKTLVGWEQGSPSINESLTRSDSNLFFQEAHALLTLRAMEGIMPEGENLSNYLEGLTERGIKKVVQRFVQDKVINYESQNIIDRRTLFDGAGRMEARTPNNGKLVGFEITPIRAKGVTMTISKVGLQFTGNTGTVRLYLFHSSKAEPVSFKDMEYTAPRGSYMWFDVADWVLPYVTSETNAGGSWYVVYDQSALPPYMESINFGRDWSAAPCGTCNKGDAQLYNLMSRYYQISPFYVAQGEWDGHMWDLEDMIYTMGNNYGINLQFSLACDITDILIAERLNFASVVQLQVACEALRALALNPEVAVNRVQFNADRDNILYETDGNGQGIRGLKGDLERAYKAISVDTKGLDPVCLGCHNKGIRFGSI